MKASGEYETCSLEIYFVTLLDDEKFPSHANFVFAGDLKDTSGTYTTCFYLFGATHLISSGVLFSELLSWCVNEFMN